MSYHNLNLLVIVFFRKNKIKNQFPSKSASSFYENLNENNICLTNIFVSQILNKKKIY